VINKRFFHSTKGESLEAHSVQVTGASEDAQTLLNTPSTTPVDATGQETVGPEIPINEYWDFGTMGNGVRLYVNNTDKNVIYALNGAGKIVWTILGKDHGFSSYEIRLRNDRLFITDFHTDGYQLWVFRNDGVLAWSHEFNGYLDMPQMKIAGNSVFLGSRGKDGGLRAFDMDTGTILWEQTQKGVGTDVEDGGDVFITMSGGIGPGRLIYRYVISKTTGEVLDYTVKITDGEYGQDKKDLIFAPMQGIVRFSPWFSDEVLWQLSASSTLYQFIEQRLHGNAITTVLHDIILSHEITNGRTISYAFDKRNGELLWKKEQAHSEHSYVVRRAIDANGILVYQVNCADCSVPVPWAYPNYLGDYNTELWGIDEKTGDIIWEYKRPLIWFKGIDADAGTVTVGVREGDTIGFYVYLDLKTGVVVYKK
jgi:outer membrane protein assembly factor BamB